MPPEVSQSSRWLAENGQRELELLLRAVVYHPSTAILIADDQRNHLEASAGASRLLGLPRGEIVGRQLDEFAAPGSKAEAVRVWQRLLERGEADGTLQVLGSGGGLTSVEFTVKANVLPLRHVVVLHEKAASASKKRSVQKSIPLCVQDYALYLMNAEGKIAAWYSGAERIYGYTAEEAVSRHGSFLYPQESTFAGKLQEELQRTVAEGHLWTEGWQERKGASTFWANSITMALNDEHGKLHGFARVVRDFGERHEADEKLRREAVRLRLGTIETTVVGVVAGEFDLVKEVNDAFLELVGYSRQELTGGLLHWPALTPAEYAFLDEVANEEGLRFGACTPYEKELIRKDGSRVSVLVATAVVKLTPFRWISFVQDLRGRNRRESVEAAEEDIAPQQEFAGIIGASTAMKRVLRQVEVVAPTDANVLILGETGTGKELIARAIHRLSPRSNFPFVTLNCAAIPTGLLESELFGYERGAFTGALSQKIGRFEMAHRGTLFLDEVGDIPLDLQPKLLRALQEKSFERLGGTKTIPIDVRLVAATNRNLTEMMGEKLFRSDLYYRLKVFPITTPPLRDRPEDIPVLARYFVKQYGKKMGRQIDTIPSEVMASLVSWHWPGNVRELENFVERAVILTPGTILRAPIGELRNNAAPTANDATLEHVEREHILRVLRESRGVVTTAAKRLGLQRTTLNAMMRKLGISRKDI